MKAKSEKGGVWIDSESYFAPTEILCEHCGQPLDKQRLRKKLGAEAGRAGRGESKRRPGARLAGIRRALAAGQSISEASKKYLREYEKEK